MSKLLWAERAWMDGGFQKAVLLEVGEDGCWAQVQAGVHVPPEAAAVLPGPVLPGLVDAHSHAFQRAFAGLAERRSSEHDDFWSWRERMYGVARRITPAWQRAVAAQLYVELLRGGYTQVCEFHYLHHAVDGQPYEEPLAMSWALADAAADAGIGLTLLPVLYERAGFDDAALNSEQRRFHASAEDVWRMSAAIAGSGRAHVSAGLAVHSLRAARPESIAHLYALAQGFAGPLHIHVAEQVAEVRDSLAVLGARPIAWLAGAGLLDARVQLVHATHAEPKEIEAVARSGAGVVLCPSTEANLGDGLCDLPGWLASGTPIALGSDSHVCRDLREELRLLEYGQRLLKRARNVAADSRSQPSTAERLWSRVLQGGAGAAGFARWGLVRGARADALVLDAADDALLGLPPSRLLDGAVFSSPGRPFREVMVAGDWRVRSGEHVAQARIAHDFEAAMRQLWPDS